MWPLRPGLVIVKQGGVHKGIPQSLDFRDGITVEVDKTTGAGIIRGPGGGPPGTLYPYDVIIYFPEVPSSGEKMWGMVADRALTFGAGLLGSKARADVAATSDSTLILKQAGTTVATVTFAAGSSTGSFTCAAEFVLAVGDELTLWAPSVADATLAGVEITLYGTRASAGESGTIPGQVGPVGATGAKGDKGDPGLNGWTGNLSGGAADSVYGGTAPLDCGGA